MFTLNESSRESDISLQTLADLRDTLRTSILAVGPISFIFIQFSANCEIIGWHTPSGKSWIRHWLVTGKLLPFNDALTAKTVITKENLTSLLVFAFA